MSPKQSTTTYSELEAAMEIGISVEELRSIIRQHIAKDDEELNNASVATFSGSDIVLLKILANASIAAVR